MALDTALNLLGLIISIGGLLAAGLTKQVVFTVFACALVGTTGVIAFTEYQQYQALLHTESKIKQKLSTNRWTEERISEELKTEDKKLIRDALLWGADRGTLDDERTECISSKDGVLTTRVYFNSGKQ